VPTPYADSVFINCPFDAAYQPLFDATIFAVMECGFLPRSALEVVNSGGVRIEKIGRIIRESRLGIHDLSRTELDPIHKLPRFNMPLELGLFLGAQRYGDAQQQRKRCIIFDREHFRYQKFCSDLAGQDIEVHGDAAPQVISSVRNWLSTMSDDDDTILPGGDYIAVRYEQYRDELPMHCTLFNLSEEDLTFTDKRRLVRRWLEMNR